MNEEIPQNKPRKHKSRIKDQSSDKIEMSAQANPSMNPPAESPASTSVGPSTDPPIEPRKSDSPQLRSYTVADVESLARVGSPLSEIAALLGTRKEKLKHSHLTEFLRGRAQLRQALRRQQLAMASVENPDLRLIFLLGKEYLRQGSEKTVSVASHEPPKSYVNIRTEDV